MATIYVNNQISSSTDITNGQPIDQSDTYTILIDNNYSTSLYANVYFYKSTGRFDWEESYNEKPITEYSYWTNKGWMGPYTHETVVYGSADIGNAGPDTYGTLSAIKGIFTDVPSSVCIIGVEYHDGTAWSDRYYWTCKATATHHTIRCYTNNSWQDCIIKYYDGTQWVECIPKYYDGTQWVECSF